MDDGEVDSPSSGGLLDPYSQILDDSSVIQNDWDTLIETQICSHKHICNPTTGPDNTHTHTCEHTHTHTIGSGDDEKLTKKRRPSGNKEAVRKYREKQKAVKVNLEVRNAELEKENQRIPELQKENVRLRRKLQEQGPRQDAVEHLLAENKRLRRLLSQLRRAIDSELDGLEGPSYQKLMLAPSKMDRFPAGAHCAAPVPCFPVANNHTGGSDDLQHMEASLGWHAECELAKTVPACRGPQQDSEDVVVGAHPCIGFKAPKVPEDAGNTAISLAGSTQKRVANTATADKQSGRSGQNVATAIGGAPAYQQMNLAGTDSCPMAALPLPCFDNGSGPAAASLQAGSGAQQEVIRWQDVCELGSRDADSCSLPGSCLSTPDDGRQSASTLLSEATLVSPSSKKVAVETGNEVNFFPSECFYPDDVMSETAANCWNRQLLLPNEHQSWLEECDIIDGVCQAHLANAIQSSCFKPPGEAGHGTSISAVVLPSTM